MIWFSELAGGLRSAARSDLGGAEQSRGRESARGLPHPSLSVLPEAVFPECTPSLAALFRNSSSFPLALRIKIQSHDETAPPLASLSFLPSHCFLHHAQSCRFMEPPQQVPCLLPDSPLHLHLACTRRLALTYLSGSAQSSLCPGSPP